MKIKNCENCTKEFKTYPKNEAIRRFCSFDCRKSIYTPEMRTKMSRIKKEQFSTGLTTWNKGKTGIYSPETLAKMSAATSQRTGPLAANWKGGVTYFSVRATRKRENGGSHTVGEWETLKKQYGDTCPACRIPDLELVRDHVIPLAKGGSDNIENIQPLCRSCNAKKHTTIVRYEVVPNY